MARLRRQRDLAVALAETTRVEEAAELALDAVEECPEVDAVGVYVVDTASEDLVLVASKGGGEDFVRTVARFSAESRQARLLRVGQPIYARHEDVMEIDAVRRAEGFKAIGMIPVQARETTVGALNVASRTDNDLSVETREWLEMLAGLISGAVARVRAEQAAQAQRRNLEALFGGIDDLALVVGDDGVVLEVNQVVERRCGQRRERLIGAPATTLVDPHVSNNGLVELLSGTARYRRGTGGLVGANGSRLTVEAHATDGEWGGRPARYVICRDITETVRAQSELRQSEERFRTVADYTHDWEYWLSADRELFYTSPSCERITGYTTEEFVANPDLLVEITDPVDRARIEQHLRDEVGSAPPCRLMHRIIRRDGAVRWVEHVCQEVRSGDGALLGRRASIRDVTEQRRTEQALRESERLYRETLAAISDAVLVVDLSGRFLVVSGNVRGVFGLTVQEVFAAETIWAVLGDDACDLAEASSGTQPSARTVHSASGKILEVRSTATPIHGGSVLVTCREVTAEHQARRSHAALQEAIRRAASEWQATFDTVAAMIILLDDSGHVVRLNQAARRFFDRRFDQLVGCPVSSLPSSVLMSAVEELYEAVCSGGEQLERIVASDNGDAWWQVVGSATSVDDAVRVVIIAREITAVVELERSLQKSERMSAMGELVGAVAHEVRNPLFALSATVDAFVEQFRGDTAMAPFLAALQRQVERLSDLMGQLLEFGRRPESSLVLGDLRKVVREAVLMQRPATEERSIEIVVSGAEEVPRVMLNQDRMLMLVRNLLDNACQFSPQGSRVGVAIRSEAPRPGEEQLVLTVRDHGPGFGDLDTVQVFDPFFSRRPGGTGLGLSIVERVAEEHGGVVTASNHPAGGAVVEVRIPRDHHRGER